jgi:hypothetical protein
LLVCFNDKANSSNGNAKSGKRRLNGEKAMFNVVGIVVGFGGRRMLKRF